MRPWRLRRSTTLAVMPGSMMPRPRLPSGQALWRGRGIRLIAGAMREPRDGLAAALDAAEYQHEQDHAAGETGPREYTETAVARRLARQACGTLAYDHSGPGWLI